MNLSCQCLLPTKIVVYLFFRLRSMFGNVFLGKFWILGCTTFWKFLAWIKKDSWLHISLFPRMMVILIELNFFIYFCTVVRLNCDSPLHWIYFIRIFVVLCIHFSFESSIRINKLIVLNSRSIHHVSCSEDIRILGFLHCNSNGVFNNLKFQKGCFKLDKIIYHQII